MGFWLKRIIVMLLVAIAAAVFIVFMPQKITYDEQGNPVERRSIQSNMAAFYEEFSLVSSDKIEEKYGDFVIPLEPSNAPLSEQLQALNRPQINADEQFNWQGSVKQRAFAKDSTLMTNADTYSNAEGINLIWNLNQDFIVRHRFSSNNTVSGMLRELAGAIDANFVNTVQVYYCDKQRTMVITDQEEEILQTTCMIVSEY